jgi:hypothetical protein
MRFQTHQHYLQPPIFKQTFGGLALECSSLLSLWLDPGAFWYIGGSVHSDSISWFIVNKLLQAKAAASCSTPGICNFLMECNCNWMPLDFSEVVDGVAEKQRAHSFFGQSPAQLLDIPLRMVFWIEICFRMRH